LQGVAVCVAGCCSLCCRVLQSALQGVAVCVAGCCSLCCRVLQSALQGAAVCVAVCDILRVLRIAPEILRGLRKDLSHVFELC